jgi:CRP-like cAMP-binding protein
MDADQVRAIARTALHSCPVFRILPKEVIEQLAQIAGQEHYDEPTLIMERGKRATSLRYTVAGHMVGKTHDPDGHEVELIPYGVGQWMTWLGTFSGGPMVQDYWASAGATFIAFPNERLLEITNPYPIIYRPMLDEVGQRFRTALDWIWTTNLSVTEVRAARHLLILCHEFEPSPRMEIAVSQDSLARTLGLSRQTLSRLLKGLEERGFLEIGYRTLRIIDLDGLRAFARDPLL